MTRKELRKMHSAFIAGLAKLSKETGVCVHICDGFSYYKPKDLPERIIYQDDLESSDTYPLNIGDNK